MAETPQYNGDLLEKQHDQFIQSFLDEKAPRYQRLIAPVGLGKSIMAVKLIKEITQAKNSQILFLLPTRELVEQYRYLLNRENPEMRVEVVDMRRFRELLTRAGLDESPWPANAVLLLTIATAKSSQVFEYMIKTEWDLIVSDNIRYETYESAALDSLQAGHISVLELLLEKKNAKRILILDSLEQKRYQKGGKNNFGNVMTTRWGSDWGLSSKLKNLKLYLETLDYLRSPEEIDFIQKYIHLQKQSKNTPYAQLFRLRKISSSLYAAEQSLRQIRNKLVHENTLSFLNSDNERELNEDLAEDADDYVLKNEQESLNSAQLTTGVQNLLNTFSHISIDCKLDTLLAYIKSFPKKRRVMIFSSYTATISYIHSSLAEQRDDIYVLSSETAQLQAKQFMINGGILIASTASLTGTDIELDDLIFYDTLSDSALIQQVIGRLFRNRYLLSNTQKRIVVIRDQSGIIPTEKKRLQELQKVVSRIQSDLSDDQGNSH